MSMLTRLANRVRPQRLGRDLHDEVQFHIEMRAQQNQTDGTHPDEATTQAQQQFGDVDAVVAAMRKERMASTTQLLTITACVVAVVVMWIGQERKRSGDLMMPAPPAAPAVRDPEQLSGLPPPPRPGPGPTWDQYVKQTKAFEALQKGPGTYAPGRVVYDKAHSR
jgi:hypothetical protein